MIKKLIIIITLLFSNQIYCQGNLDIQIEKGVELYQSGKAEEAVKIWKHIEKKAKHKSSVYVTVLQNILFYYLEKDDETNILAYYLKLMISGIKDRVQNDAIATTDKNYRYKATTTLASYYGQKKDFETALRYVEIADNDLKFETDSLENYRYQKVNLAFWKFQLLKDLEYPKIAVSKLIKRAFEYDYKAGHSSWVNVSINEDDLELAETILSEYDDLYNLKNEIDRAIDHLILNRLRQQIQLTIFGIDYVINFDTKLENEVDSESYLKNSFFYKFLIKHIETENFNIENNRLKHGLSTKEIDLFLQIILKAEFLNQEEGVKKWEKDLLVFLKNPEKESLVNEFEEIIREINSLSASISVKRVFEESEANYIIFFSSQETFANFEPSAAPYLEGNLGFFTLNYNNQSVITRGCMYVDVERIKELQCQKHILREELTQSLGILNDHNDEEESIFYSEWTCSTEYSQLDRKLIRIFLDPNLKAGMNRDELKDFLKL